jgi:hypothetical protein
MRRSTLFFLEVEGHAALVAVEVLKVRPMARAARRIAGFHMRRGLDLDHIGAPIGELAHRRGAGPNPCQIENGEPFERLRSSGKWHPWTLENRLFWPAERAGG